MIESTQHHDDIENVPPPASTLRLLGRGSEWSELTEAFASGRMHHAWLLQGPAGIGKATTAFAFARRIAGDMPSGVADDLRFDPDSAVVRQIAQAAHPRILHLTRPPVERGEGFKTQITVDEIRRLNHFFQSTSGGAWRVAILDPADDLNRSAANALLKTLEEPPPRSLFLIVNHAAGRILPTIRSRCRVLRFEALPENVVAGILAEVAADDDASERRQAAASSGGAVRTALATLRNGGHEIVEATARLLSLTAPDWTAVHAMTDSLVQKGREAAFGLALEAFAARLAAEAEEALQNRPQEAARLAALWQSETARWREAAAYNLDRKQVVLTFFHNLYDLRRQLREGAEV